MIIWNYSLDHKFHWQLFVGNESLGILGHKMEAEEEVVGVHHNLPHQSHMDHYYIPKIMYGKYCSFLLEYFIMVGIYSSITTYWITYSVSGTLRTVISWVTCCTWNFFWRGWLSYWLLTLVSIWRWNIYTRSTEKLCKYKIIKKEYYFCIKIG